MNAPVTVRIPLPLPGVGGPAPGPVVGTCKICQGPALVSEHHYADPDAKQFPVWVHARTWDAYRGTIHTAEV